MKTILVAIAVVASLAAATVLSRGGDSIKVTNAGAIIAGPPPPARPAYPKVPHPGYIAYADYDLAVPAPQCYWTRLPVYDADRNIVGWRGSPVAVCP